MKIVRYMDDGMPSWGMVEGETIRRIDGDPYGEIHLARQTKRIAEAKLLAPCTPSKIVAVGLNYRAHAEELKMGLPKEPLIFLKPPTAVIGPGEPIIYPKDVGRLDYEAELALVIGKVAKAVSEHEAADYILGYTCFNDVTARDIQQRDRQWARAKGYDTFAPIGPWIVTDIDASRLEISSYLNGERRQHSNTSDMIFGPMKLVEFVSNIMTLFPGDVIATGTPPGIGPMNVGDRIEVVIEGIGILSNTVADG